MAMKYLLFTCFQLPDFLFTLLVVSQPYVQSHNFLLFIVYYYLTGLDASFSSDPGIGLVCIEAVI